jgi:hypothetical protein
MSALGLSLLTYLTVDVRAYFLYVEDCFRELMDSDTETFFDKEEKRAEMHDKHHTMMDCTFLLTQIICTAVAFVFFGIAWHVLFVLADSLPAVFWIVFVLMAAYLTLQALEVLLRILPSVSILPEENQLMAAWVYYWCSYFVMFIVTCTVLGTATEFAYNHGDRIRLRQLESV